MGSVHNIRWLDNMATWLFLSQFESESEISHISLKQAQTCGMFYHVSLIHGPSVLYTGLLSLEAYGQKYRLFCFHSDFELSMVLAPVLR